MRRGWIIAGGGTVLVLAYLTYILVISGTFKTIEPHFDGVCRTVAQVPGAEDITLHPNGEFALISSDDRRATSAGAPVPGGIYALDLLHPDAQPVNLTPRAPENFHPHGIGLYVDDGGAGTLFVVNHPRASLFNDARGDGNKGPAHTIEVYELVNERLTHLRQLSDPALVSPNDIVPIDHERFYVTNDHGSTSRLGHKLEDYGRLARGQVLYYDGQRFSKVLDGIRYANGINLSPDGKQVYVASPSDGDLYVFDRDETTGALTERFVQSLGTGIDNIEVEADGTLWLGAHPKLLSFVAYASQPGRIAPSEVLRLTPNGQGDFDVMQVFLDDGTRISASSVAAHREGRLLIGSVMDPYFLDCRMGPG